jgi:hypothetical protein
MNLTQLWDSVSGYVPETPELLMFDEVFKSDLSRPVAAGDFEVLTIECRIDFSASALARMLGVGQGDRKLLGIIAARYFVGSQIASVAQRADARITRYLTPLKKSLVIELCPQCPFLAVRQSPGDFLASTPMLAPSVPLLFDCGFMAAPDDIAYALHQIHLRFSAFVAGQMKAALGTKAIVDGEKALWRILFIASGLPTIDSLFQFLEDHRRFPIYHGEIFREVLVPLGVWRALVANA